MKFYRLTIFLVFIFLLAADSHLQAAEIENKTGKKIMNDTELKTEGAATRKPLPSIEKDEKKEEVRKPPSFMKEGERGTSFDISFYQMSGEITREVNTTRKVLEGSPFSGFPRTRFEFPIDALLCSVNNRIMFSRKWGIGFSFSKSVAMTSEDETVNSSWWGRVASETANELWANPNSLDYITESKADMDLMDLGGLITYRVYRKSDFILAANLGYFQQYITYETKDFWGRFFLASNYPTHYQFDYIVSLTGPSEKYSFTYQVPYLEIEADYCYKNRLCLSANLGYSPYAKIENEFVFYNTMVLEQGDGTGSMVMFSMEAMYFLNENMSLKINFGYEEANLDGEKTQYSSGVWLGETDQKVDMEKFIIGLGFQYDF